MTTNRLNAKIVQNAKPKEVNGILKDNYYSDGGGLYLVVTPKGNKLWRYHYSYNNKKYKLALGKYPNLSLKEARALHKEAVNQKAKGINPIEERRKLKEEKKKIEKKQKNTFYNISQKWLENYKKRIKENTYKNRKSFIELHIYPFIQNKPIDEISIQDIIQILETAKNKNLKDVPHRLIMLLNQIFKFAVAYELIPHNIIADIDKQAILGKYQESNYPTLKKLKDIKALLLAIDEYQGIYSTQMALKLLPYIFVRSSNIRNMEWKEINFKTKEWIIPAEKMKSKEEFILPLPHQAIKILKEVKKNALGQRYVFPSNNYHDRPLSENTLNTALRRMGYTKEELVSHSFRSIFSTIAYENMDKHGFSGEVIEALLAHKDNNKVRSAYNRAEYKEQKKDLIQWYANYLDEVKNGSI